MREIHRECKAAEEIAALCNARGVVSAETVNSISSKHKTKLEYVKIRLQLWYDNVLSIDEKNNVIWKCPWERSAKLTPFGPA